MAVALWLVLGAIGVVATEMYLADSEARLEREVGTRLRSTTAALEQNLLRSLEAVEGLHALAQARHNLLRASSFDAATSIGNVLADAAREGKFGVLQVAVISAAGMLAWSSVPDWTIYSLADREHFRVHAEGLRGLFVSRPLVGRTSGRWSLQLTRAILEPDGSFGGVVVVSLDPLMLSRHLAEVHEGRDEVAAVLRMPEGELVARSVDAEGQLGRPLPRRHPALDAAERAPEGYARAVSLHTGHEVLLGYRRMQAAPLLLVVSQDWADVIAPLEELEHWVRAAVVGGLLLLLVGVLLWLEARETRSVRQALAEAEAAHAATELAWAELKRLLAAAPAAIYAGEVPITEAPGTHRMRVRFLSPNLQRVAGFEATTERLLDELAARLDPQAAPRRGAFCQAILRDGVAAAEFRLIGTDGAARWIREEARVVGPTRTGVEVVAYLSDITSQRALEAQAFSAAKMATLGEMAANLAHELAQPLAVITLASENAAAALEEGLAEEIPQALARLEVIAQQAVRCKAVINHLRLFSRGEGAGELAAISLQEVLDGVLLLTSGTLRDAEIELRLELPERLPAVLGQRTAAEQVFVNLLLNARDALETQPREAERRITIAAAAAAGELHVTVADTGGGIPPGVLDRMFEPFFTTKEPGKGTGIGLSICHGTMQAFGGGISAANGAEGAVFLLRFRVAPAPRPGRGAPALAGAVP